MSELGPKYHPRLASLFCHLRYPLQPAWSYVELTKPPAVDKANKEPSSAVHEDAAPLSPLRHHRGHIEVADLRMNHKQSYAVGTAGPARPTE